MPDDAQRERLMRELTAGADGPAQLYAVVDASRSPMIIPAALRGMTQDVACLYRGRALEEFGDDTAWVARIAPDESVLDWLVDEGFGQRWAIFARSSLPLADLVRHLRRFTMVQDETERVHFFRFYDPRTLRQYLPALDRAQARSFFAGIDAFLCENDRRPDELLRFTLGPGGAERQTIALGAQADTI